MDCADYNRSGVASRLKPQKHRGGEGGHDRRRVTVGGRERETEQGWGTWIWLKLEDLSLGPKIKGESQYCL